MSRFYIYTHAPSDGARRLARALDGHLIRYKGSKYVPRNGDTIINWGSHRLPDRLNSRYIRVYNSPGRVAQNADKLSCFRLWGSAVNTPPWSTDRKTARSWGSDVVVRHITNGSAGHGIEIVEKGLDIPNAPLYTKYIPKKAEYRVHIIAGYIVDIQRKIKDPTLKEPKNWQIRNHDNGFIFVRNSLHYPSSVQKEAMKAFNASGLDFGAFDIIVDKYDSSFVLEVNNAPGLEGQTVTNYATAFKRIIK